MKARWWILPALLIAAIYFGTGCDDGEGCATGESECGGACINVYSDSANCGSCGNACGADQICSGGECQCSGGSPVCGTTCCPAEQVCYNDTCQACADREACNGVDDDCDGQVDNGLQQPCNNACGQGTETCVSGTWANCTAPTAGTEVCDGQDNDCNGQTDEGVTVTLYVDSDNDTFGDLNTSIQGCPGLEGHSENSDDCDDTNENINPDAEEDCEDTVDNNCDDAVNEGCTGCAAGQVQECGEGGNTGECEYGSQTCDDAGDGPEWGECEGGVRPVEEACDGVDNDCDGNIDDGIPTDVWEGNDTCILARGPLEVEEDGDALEIGGTLYNMDGSPDEDWFIIDNSEGVDACIIPWSNECNFYMDVIFTPPNGAAHEDWAFCLYRHEDEDDCETAVAEQVCTTAGDWNESTSAYELSVGWMGECWFEDGRNYFGVVRPADSATISDCNEYQLSLSFRFVDEDECFPED